MRQNAFAAGAPPRTPLGELTALPRPLAGFRGGEGDGQARGKEKWEGKGEGEGRKGDSN